jgi:hypothetical protein
MPFQKSSRRLRFVRGGRPPSMRPRRASLLLQWESGGLDPRSRCSFISGARSAIAPVFRSPRQSSRRDLPLEISGGPQSTSAEDLLSSSGGYFRSAGEEQSGDRRGGLLRVVQSGDEMGDDDGYFPRMGGMRGVLLAAPEAAAGSAPSQSDEQGGSVRRWRLLAAAFPPGASDVRRKL